MYLEHRLSALLQLDLHSRLNNWLQWVVQRQLQDETRTIQVLQFGATYSRDFTVLLFIFPKIFLEGTIRIKSYQGPFSVSYSE